MRLSFRSAGNSAPPSAGLSASARPAWLFLATTCLAASAVAAPLTFTLDQPDQLGAAGQTFEFFGTIRNDSGVALQTTDLFFDFSGFDPAFLAPTQLLGTTESTLGAGATSGRLELFEIGLAPAATAQSTYFSDVVLQDANADLSDPVTVSVSVVPEPSTAMLALVGLLPLAWHARRRRPVAPSALPEVAA